MLLASPAAVAQAGDIPTCKGRIYSAKEVTRRARITEHPNYDAILEAFGRWCSKRGSFWMYVLCRSGRDLGYQGHRGHHRLKSAEWFVKAISLLEFYSRGTELPHGVATAATWYRINYGDRVTIDSAAAAGRLVESIDIIGNRRLTAKSNLFLDSDSSGRTLQRGTAQARI